MYGTVWKVKQCRNILGISSLDLILAILTHVGNFVNVFVYWINWLELRLEP